MVKKRMVSHVKESLLSTRILVEMVLLDLVEESAFFALTRNHGNHDGVPHHSPFITMLLDLFICGIVPVCVAK
jgi:hypothetical protein